jgi:hypothetical protein
VKTTDHENKQPGEVLHGLEFWDTVKNRDLEFEFSGV